VVNKDDYSANKVLRCNRLLSVRQMLQQSVTRLEGLWAESSTPLHWRLPSLRRRASFLFSEGPASV